MTSVRSARENPTGEPGETLDPDSLDVRCHRLLKHAAIRSSSIDVGGEVPEGQSVSGMFLVRYELLKICIS